MKLFKNNEELKKIEKADRLRIAEILENDTKPANSKLKLDVLRNFDSVKDYFKINFVSNWEIKDARFKTILIRVRYSMREIVHSDISAQKYEYYPAEYFWIYQEREKDYGKIVVRPETLKDKVEEFFFKQELDFEEDQLFSWKYFVLADKKELARHALNEHSRRLILKNKGIVVDFNGKKRLMRFTNSVNSVDLEKLIKFSKEL